MSLTTSPAAYKSMSAAQYAAWRAAGGNLAKAGPAPAPAAIAGIAAPAPAAPTGQGLQPVRTTDLAGLQRALVSADLGPGVPLNPMHPELVQPRMFDYVPGYNIAIQPRTYEDIQFGALRGLARSWDVASLCIQRNIDDLRQLRWEIRPKAVPGMDRDMVKQRRQRLEAVRAEVEGFWMTPDQTRSWSSWVHAFFQEMYETDAACLYLETTRDGRSLYGVQLVDGSTIAPLVDSLGRPPRPPEPAYRQVIRGLPWQYYMADLAQDPDQRNLWFDQSHMIYEPFWGRTDSPYGHPPMEWVLLTAQRALARQVLDFRLFNDGTTAFDFWKMPDSWSEEQIASLQAAFDQLMQMPTERAHLRFMPGGTGAGLEHGFLEPKTEGEEFLLHVGCAAYNRSPMEMGFIRSAGGAGLGGKSVAQEQGRSANKGVRAAAFHLKALVDRVTGLHFSPELEIVFPELEDVEDAETRAKAEDIRVKNGTLGIDEARLDRDLDPIGPAGKPSNLIFLGTNPPVQAVTALSQEAPEPPPGGDNPPVPSAVPGRATDAALGKALGGGHVEYTGDLAERVHRYLLRSYPAKDVEWVLDPAIDWEYDKSVPLDSIDMARRPGGRNPDKVAAIAGRVESGASMDPVVLVDFGDPELDIADGYHRTLGVEHAGKGAVPAFIGRHAPDRFRDLVRGRMQDDSASKQPAGDLRKADLDRWMRKSLGAVKRGRPAAVRFESDAIPPETAAAVSAALAAATSPAQVRAMFEVLADA